MKADKNESVGLRVNKLMVLAHIHKDVCACFYDVDVEDLLYKIGELSGN